ncbi:RidA family protein [Plantactinospora sp. B5E13]|uniref:RidA family protein n=1 Tax=unclassified Plantactinospora TaxID=2631981 RepID=UPI00325E8022
MKPQAVTTPEIPTGNSYVPAIQISTPGRLVFVSGQVPERADGYVPADFASQCRLAWENVLTTLRSADMDAHNLVKVTTFLSDRRYREENSRIRDEFLKDHQVALTIIITGIYDRRWLLEIEAVAAG